MNQEPVMTTTTVRPVPTRRTVLAWAAGSAAITSLAGCGTMSPSTPLGRVVVVGGGFGGATAAKYLRLWSDNRIDVTLVEPDASFISCPLSNLVVGGSKRMGDVTIAYAGLAKYGVKKISQRAAAIDADKRIVMLADGSSLPYDRLVMAPGIEFMFEDVRGMTAASIQQMPHAWRAGAQTTLLRNQLTAMADGGVVVMSVPMAPYRCPPGPYERACQIASYLKAQKPKSKLIVLDANDKIVSKPALFGAVFNDDYKGVLEYRPNSPVTEVDVAGRTFITEIGDKTKGDVMNLIPPQRAANIARDAGVITANKRWCEVDWMTMESTKVKNVHIIGDATQSAPLMPKSGHMANQHGKTVAAAIVELMNGRAPIAPMMTNTCYSYIDATSAVHVASVHRYVAEKKTMETVAGAGGVSPLDRAQWGLEGVYAQRWAENIWMDMLG
jgi:sulfide dehydrogenase [flavocytochrome c] flavoprotein chain